MHVPTLELEQFKEKLISEILLPTPSAVTTPSMPDPLMRGESNICLFCGEQLVPERVGDGWHTKCSCREAKLALASYESAFRAIRDAQASLEALNRTMRDEALSLFKKLYPEYIKLRDEVVDKFDKQVMSIETLNS
jgi:hypothetical protein